MNLVVTTPEQLTEIIEIAVNKAIKKELQPIKEQKIYSLHQAKKRLGIGDDKLKRFIADGTIKVTSDNKITEFELNKYLGNE